MLLILAGVSIATLTRNNGILTQASKAKENTAKAEEDENNRLDANNDYINEHLGKVVPGKMVTKTERNNYSDGTNTATVPQGFTVSGIKDEQKITNGLVIYDIPESEISSVDWSTASTKYNQFVWIPVTSEEAYQRDFTYPSYYNMYNISDNTEVGSAFTDTDYLPSNIQPVIDNSENNEKAERNAVLKYNGFYIARYEAGKEGSNVVSKQNATVYVNETQISFKAIGKAMYGDNSQYVKSAMCSGIQWDMVMKFIEGKTDGKGNVFNVRQYNLYRLSTFANITLTGQNIADEIQNIYDLEGNSCEFVAEQNNDSNGPSTFRGAWPLEETETGRYGASLRVSYNGNAYSNNTFRPVLYIK